MLRLEFREDYDKSQIGQSGPWPGPVPYSEGDRHFRGRGTELGRLVRRIDREPVLLITGYSGTGKTSFLRAGIIPILRDERARVLLNGGEKTATPAVLVVRDWLTATHGEHRGHDEILIDAIHEAIEALRSDILPTYDERENNRIREMIDNDYESLSQVKQVTTAYDYVAELAESVGSLLLCMDQFEEVLQGNEQRRFAILDTVANLVKRHGRSVKILLSFRQEFSFLFQRLDRQLGNLAQATEYLDEMPKVTVRTAVLESAESAGIQISEDVIDKLLNWMQGIQMSNDTVEAKTVEGTVDNNLAENLPTSTASQPGAIDLLRLQALLQELFQLASSEVKPGENVSITEGTLDSLLARERSDNPHLDGPSLVRSALGMFLERHVLPLPLVNMASDEIYPATLNSTIGLPKYLNEEDEQTLVVRLQQRRIAARMAEYFSSLGLKVQQYEAHLISSALRQEWEVLGLSSEDVESFLDSVGLKVGLNKLDQLNLPDDEIDPRDGIISGRIFVGKKWTYLDAVKMLFDRSRETLDRFVNYNILRPKMAERGIVYELVHDGFGPALSEWSEDIRNDPLDALETMTAQRGVSFRWKRLGGSIERVCWRGCLVGPATGCEEMLFDNVEWIGCDLRGTLFRQCVFNGGSFDDCELHGAMFINCTFKDSAGLGARFTFNGIESVGLDFLGCSLEKVDFIQCSLDKMLWGSSSSQLKPQVEISDVTFNNCQRVYQWSIEKEALILSGPFHMIGCKLDLCDLSSLLSYGEHIESAVDIRDCEFNYCLLEEKLTGIIHAKNNQVYP